MASKNRSSVVPPEEGKSKEQPVMFSAGEVATYVVCPEAWRLSREVERQERSPSAQKGRALHSRWATNLDEAYALLVGVRILLYLLGAAIIVLLLILNN